MSLPEALEPNADTSNKFVAIYIAVLAVLLALNAVGGGNSAKTIMTAGIEINDTWGFYQAKNMRQTTYRLTAEMLEIEAMNTNLPEAMRKAIQDKVTAYRATANRYDSEPDTGEGKKELAAKAKKFDAERQVALKQDPYFDYSGALLQIAIVLASASLLLGGRLLLYSSFGLGIVGTLLLANAFFLFVSIPFMS